jgi:hypothetical protein
VAQQKECDLEGMLLSCVTLGKLLTLSESQFPSYYDNNTYLM